MILVSAKIRGVKYTPFLCRKLRTFGIKDLAKGLDSDATFILKVDSMNSIALSWWVSAKRTRSYPYSRVYDSFKFAGKKVTVIPIIKEKVIKLYKSGLSRLEISIKLGINVKRINKWLGKSRAGRPYKAYPPDLKNKVRRLVKLGMQKTEIPNILGIGYPTVVRLTHDLKGDKSRVSGRYFKLLCKLINDGFILMRRKDLKIYKILKKHAYIRSAVFGKDALLFIRGGEKAAEKALLSKSKDISKRRLNTIKQVLLQQK